VNIQVLSDIHAEFHQDQGRMFIEQLPVDGTDVLVVAGDLAVHHNLEYCLQALSKKVPHVVFVMGNHEFYHSTRHAILRSLKMVQEACPNLHVLENSATIIDGQRFVGCTLWFEDVPASWEFRDRLNDFHIINGGFTDWFPQLNTESRLFLEGNVMSQDVVVTHHVPTPKGSHPRFDGEPLNYFFTCDMEHVIQQEQPKLWVYGHTHDSHDFHIGDTRLVCNPFGYLRRQENSGFEWKKVIQV